MPSPRLHCAPLPTSSPRLLSRHTAEIAQFAKAHGVRLLGVHTTRKGRSKAQHLQELLPPGQRAVFVDDSVHEVSDPRIAGDERVFRVLFQRGGM